MNRTAATYIDDLIMSGAQAPDEPLAIRCFDMAEGALAVQLLDESITTQQHQQLQSQLARTRAARLPGEQPHAASRTL